MAVAGIIAEYNPLHRGHIYQMEATRAAMGPDTAILCVMSGNFVQRGEPALLEKHARAEAAVRCGADLVRHTEGADPSAVIFDAIAA